MIREHDWIIRGYERDAGRGQEELPDLLQSTGGNCLCKRTMGRKGAWGLVLDKCSASMYIKTYMSGVLKMDAITYTTVRANLASTMDRVCNDHEALIITRNGEQSVVMLSLEDYKALEETAYLLRTPANAKRLLTAAAQLNAGKGVERKLAR